MKKPNVSFVRSAKVLALVGAMSLGAFAADQPNANTGDPELTQSIRELREQIQELRSAVSEIKSEAAEYRAENQELRKELENLRGSSSLQANREVNSSAISQVPGSSDQTKQGLSSLEETTQLTESELRTLYQTKVESASKYRVRLSGLVLLNLFHDRGEVDNLDVPAYATAMGPYGVVPAFGATLRQSELGLEVFGPQLFGAKSSGHVQMDFGGGFPPGQLDGVNTGIVRLRTASMRLDWDNTSVIAGQDNLFISPNSATSFASLIVPSFGYSGELWAWTPQLRIEHRFNLPDAQQLSIQGGILDNITGEPSDGSHRLPQAGESSGQPAYALRTAWTKQFNGRPLTFGASGYYSRQNWGFGWVADGWAGVADWRIPLPGRFEVSGEFYRGRAIGGLGGGIGQSVLFSGNPYLGFLPLDSAGGWSQLKFAATSRLEFNAAFGIDNPFASDIHAFGAPVGIYPTVLAANRSEMLNFIYRPRSDLLFSGEYRHLRTTQFASDYTNYYGADHVNFMMGVLF